MQNIAKLQHSAPLKLFYMYNVQCTYIVHSHIIRDSKSGERGEHARAIFLPLLC